MKCKKQRGQQRRLKALIDRTRNITPFEDVSLRYEHYHVPCGRFISSAKTSGKVKTAFCKAWLEKTAEIVKQNPPSLYFCKVVAVIDTGDLWYSQIVIFYDKDCYDSFWERHSLEQKWIPVADTETSFALKRNIQTSLKEIGYIETIFDSDFNKKSAIWFYGDV